MYIVSVLVEHPTLSLDSTFDYLSKQEIQCGVRVEIVFRNKPIIGYVMKCTYTAYSKGDLEELHHFKYRYIKSVVDDKPLLNKELQELAFTVSKLTLSSKIACLQAMLPTTLKPNTAKGADIKYFKSIHIIKEGIPKTEKQKAAFRYLKENKFCYVKDFPYSSSVMDGLVKQGFCEYYDQEVKRNPYENITVVEKGPELKESQINVIEGIKKKINVYHTALIHGVTGSGKTEIYLSLSEYVLKQGKNVLMMVPEISLTPMMVEAFYKRFGKDVAVIHSRLSKGEHYDEYRRIVSGEVKIVVGARSAVFAPLENIGLIILDEEHDSSYKQDSAPRYTTHQIARLRGKYHSCPVILGSATPSLESYSRAKKGIYDLYTLNTRINEKALPEVKLIDMAKEIHDHNYSMISKDLRKELRSTLDKGEQAILLLNKRGYSSYIRCLDCGEVIKCPHCDVTLTYHKAEEKMKCHYCDYTMPVPDHCPNCGSINLRTVGTGTQRMEEILEKEFDTKVIRYDVDSTRNKNGHHNLLKQFENKEAGILLGTQMLAKGLDFENVTFVGVLNADISLNIPDFRSNERTFQLLTQVAGRSGRGAKEGTVMIQTYNPGHFVFQCVKNHDYDAFYLEEMNYRRIAKYPPFCHLVSILIRSKDEEILNESSLKVKQYLSRELNGVTILGPADSGIYRLQDYYRKRMMIKFVSGKELYPVLNTLLEYYAKKHNVDVICDFNPYNTL